jgi:uncharacterized phage protein (TIGR02220 family)
MSGWIKLSRSMSDNWLWQEKPFSKGQAWVDLLMFANHRPTKILIKGQMISMSRGDQARSEVTLAESWGWSRGKVRRFLKTLEGDSMIVQQTGNATSIITICNYKAFQDGGTTGDTADGTAGRTAPGTAPEHQAVHREECKELNNGNNKQLTLSGRPDDAPVSEKLKATKQEAIEVLEFLNEKTGRNYKPVDANVRMINARLKEYSIVELRQVVAKKTRDWRHDENMEKYLRPATLFNATNCAQYVGELGQRPVDGGQR